MIARSPSLLAAALALGACAGAREPEAARPAPAAATRPAAVTAPPFSGEIVFRRTLVPDASAEPPKPLTTIHYFISGSHWKHVDETGTLLSLYDPTENVVHYFGPERRSVDASKSDGPVRFEHLPDTKSILGRTCRGLRQVSATSTFVEFYDPALFVDPLAFANHHHGHWAEILAEKRGALPLWSAVERSGYAIVSEAVRIVPRTFEPSFWALPAPNTVPGGAAPP